VWPAISILYVTSKKSITVKIYPVRIVFDGMNFSNDIGSARLSANGQRGGNENGVYKFLA